MYKCQDIVLVFVTIKRVISYARLNLFLNFENMIQNTLSFSSRRQFNTSKRSIFEKQSERSILKISRRIPKKKKIQSIKKKKFTFNIIEYRQHCFNRSFPYFLSFLHFHKFFLIKRINPFFRISTFYLLSFPLVDE